jgi:polar amino acid transport system substrate-binding protein
MKLTTRQFLKTAGLFGAGLLLGACGRKEAPAPGAAPTSEAAPGASAPAAGRTLVVGTDAAYAPFESQNEKGEIVGFDIDILTAIARKAGFEVKFVNTPWEGIFNTLQQGDRDLLISAITITEDRKQTMDFAGPYFDAYQLIAVKSDSKVAKFEDLKSLQVGVQTGTTGDEVVTKLLGKDSTHVRRFESTPLALKELEAGGVDAVVADNGVVANYVAHHANARFKTVSDSAFTPEQYGIAVKKGNDELREQLNKALAEIKTDGTYNSIYTRYFGPPTATPAPAASR